MNLKNEVDGKRKLEVLHQTRYFGALTLLQCSKVVKKFSQMVYLFYVFI